MLVIGDEKAPDAVVERMWNVVDALVAYTTALTGLGYVAADYGIDVAPLGVEVHHLRGVEESLRNLLAGAS